MDTISFIMSVLPRRFVAKRLRTKLTRVQATENSLIIYSWPIRHYDREFELFIEYSFQYNKSKSFTCQFQSKDSFSVRFQSKYNRFKRIEKMFRAQRVKNYIVKPETHYLES